MLWISKEMQVSILPLKKKNDNLWNKTVKRKDEIKNSFKFLKIKGIIIKKKNNVIVGINWRLDMVIMKINKLEYGTIKS